MVEIELTHDEWMNAAMRGCERQVDGLIKNRVSTQRGFIRQPTDGWFWNVNGAAGEACVAKWLGVPWDGCFGDLRASDVAFLEVRTTPGHDFPLRLQHEDKDDRVYILVTGVGPTWRIQGFILGAKGKQQEWFSDRPPPACKPTGRPGAFWVPQESLGRDLDLLKRRFLARYSAQS